MSEVLLAIRAIIKFIGFILFLLFGMVGVQVLTSGSNVLEIEGSFSKVYLDFFSNNREIILVFLVIMIVMWIIINIIETLEKN